MKVYTKVVIDIRTGDVVEETHFDYRGKLAWCKGGGGGGGSGKVNYPAYLETFHGEVLDNAVASTLTDCFVDTFNETIATNPYQGQTSYNPSSEIADYFAVVDSYETYVTTLSEETEWLTMLAQATNDTTGLKAFFEAPSPDAASDIATAWLDPSPDAASDIAGAWQDPTSDADSDITSAWIDPSPNAGSDIATAWLDPTLDADSDITSAWIDPTPDADSDITSAWVDPTPDADSDIATDWVDPTPDADSDIGTAWIDPNPAAEGEINDDVGAYREIVDDQLEANVLPRFQRGMQDINAVMSSAFTIGQAIIEGMASRDVNKYQGTLRVAAFTQKDQIHAASRLGESNRLADAHIQNDKLLADGKIGESRALADAHIQSDKLLADGNIGESKALTDAHVQNDKLLAEGNIGESRALADAHVQGDRLLAEGNIGESSRLADAYIQDDRLLAEGKIGESKALADAYIQDDKLLAEGKIGESKALAEAYIQDDKLLAEGKNRESEALAKAHIQDDMIDSGSLIVKNSLYVQSVGDMIGILMGINQAREAAARVVIEANRIKIVASQEEKDRQVDLDAFMATFDLSLWQHAANLIAAPSGGTFAPRDNFPSRTQSAIGGALSGAAMGAMAGSGNPYAIGAGAVIGAYLSYIS